MMRWSEHATAIWIQRNTITFQLQVQQAYSN